MAKTIDQIRQGDVLLQRVAEPESVRRATDPEGRPLAGLLVEGERTGHAHRLPARVYDTDDGDRVLFLERPTPLTHEEHEALEVPAGWWRPVQQREYLPRGTRRRAIVD